MEFGFDKLKLNRGIYFLLVLVLVMHLASFLVIPILPIILKNEKYLNTAQIGLIIGATSFAFQLGSIFSAFLSDRIGKRFTMFSGAIFEAVALVGYGLTSSYGLLFLFSIIRGIGSGMYIPTVKAAIATLTTESSHIRTTAFSLRGIAANVGISLAGLILFLFTFQNSNWVFYASAIMFGGLSIITVIFFPKSCTRDEDCAKIPLKSYANIFKNKAFVIFALIIILVNIVYAQLNILLPLRAEVIFNDNSKVGSIWTITSISVIILQVFINKWFLQKYKALTVTFWSSLFFAGSIFLIGNSNSYLLLLFSALIFTLGQMFLFPTIDSIVGKLSETGLLGAYFSITNLLTGIGTAIGATLGGKIINTYGIQGDLTPWIILSSIALVVGVFVQVIKRLKISNEIESER